MLDTRARCNGQFKHRFLEEPGPQFLPLCCSDQNPLPLSAFLLTYGGITHLELESPEAQFIRHTRRRTIPAPAVSVRVCRGTVYNQLHPDQQHAPRHPLSAFLLTCGGITHLELESPEAQFIRHTHTRHRHTHRQPRYAHTPNQCPLLLSAFQMADSPT